MDIVSLIVSVIALSASLFTLWFTILRRGSVCCTRPSYLAFTYDFLNGQEIPYAKIFLRTLLFSTSKRGLVVENLFLRVREGKRCEEFLFWGYGDENLVRGSGIFVPESGIVANHHFNPIGTGNLFKFSIGVYKLELVAKIVGKKSLFSLWSTSFNITEDAFDPINRSTAIEFNWSSEQNGYIASVRKREHL